MKSTYLIKVKIQLHFFINRLFTIHIKAEKKLK